MIPRGARSQSVPASADEASLTFETASDLTARWDFNELKVRRRRPSLVTPQDLEKRSELFVEGTGLSLQTGDPLLFVFGEGAGGARKLLPVAKTRVDRDDDVTAISLPKSAPPSLKELVDEVRRWTAAPAQPGEPGEEPPTPEVPNPRPVSRLIEDFEDQVLEPLRNDLDGVKTPERLVARLAEPLARLGEAQVLAAPYEGVAAWFGQLEAVLAELVGTGAGVGACTVGRGGCGGGCAAVCCAIGAGRAVPRAPSGRLERCRFEGPGSGTSRLARHGPEAAGAPPGGSSRAPTPHASSPPSTPASAASTRPGARPPTPGAPQLLRELLALRVTAAPFGATAPLKPVQDDRGRVIRTADWPLTGAVLATMRVVYDTAGRTPVRAEFQYVEGSSSDQRAENLPVTQPVTFTLGPGRIELSVRSGQDRDLNWLNRRPADSQEPGVTARLPPACPSARCSCPGPTTRAWSTSACTTAPPSRSPSGRGPASSSPTASTR